MINRLTPKVPLFPIGIGAAQFGIDYGFTKALSQTEVDQILNLANKAGIDFLDTARDYGESEQKIGVFCNKNPQIKFRIGTKLARMDEKTARNASTIKFFLIDSIKKSLESLGRNILPLLLVHQTDSYIIKNQDFWDAIKDVKGGSAATFGISVYDPEPAKELLRERGEIIDCIQAPYNILDRRFEKDVELRKLLRKNGIAFISRSTFLKGVLVEDKIPEQLKELEPIRKEIKRIANKYGFSAPQLLTLFVLDAKFIDCALIGVRSSEQLLENLDCLKLLQNSPEKFVKAKEELLDIPEAKDPFLYNPREWKFLP